MMTFKDHYREFLLKEMPTLLDDYDKEGNQITNKESKTWHNERVGSPTYSRIGFAKGYRIHVDRNKMSYDDLRVHAVDHRGDVHMAVIGSAGGDLNNRKNLVVTTLAGHPNSKIKAHEFYRHLVAHQGWSVQGSSSQSPGGMATWAKLSQYPDIEITHHNAAGEQIPLHTGANWHLNYTKKENPNDPNDPADSYFVARKKT